MSLANLIYLGFSAGAFGLFGAVLFGVFIWSKLPSRPEKARGQAALILALGVAFAAAVGVTAARLVAG